MAKKKKAPTPSFNPARFRIGEEASMVGVPLATPASTVDERTQFAAKKITPKEHGVYGISLIHDAQSAYQQPA